MGDRPWPCRKMSNFSKDLFSTIAWYKASFAGCGRPSVFRQVASVKMEEITSRPKASISRRPMTCPMPLMDVRNLSISASVPGVTRSDR